MPPDVCPNCGADLPPNARVCPECGSCDETGWSEDADGAGLDLPDDSFDYDEFVDREFGEKREMKPRGVRWFWWVIAILVVLAFVLRSLR